MLNNKEAILGQVCNLISPVTKAKIRLMIIKETLRRVLPETMDVFEGDDKTMKRAYVLHAAGIAAIGQTFGNDPESKIAGALIAFIAGVPVQEGVLKGTKNWTTESDQ